MNEYNVIDIWREQFKREYAYIRQNGRSMSRIHFFLVSESLLYGDGKTEARIVDGFLAESEDAVTAKAHSVFSVLLSIKTIHHCHVIDQFVYS